MLVVVTSLTSKTNTYTYVDSLTYKIQLIEPIENKNKTKSRT